MYSKTRHNFKHDWCWADRQQTNEPVDNNHCTVELFVSIFHSFEVGFKWKKIIIYELMPNWIIWLSEYLLQGMLYILVLLYLIWKLI